MRRIVGALIVLAAAVFHRAGDLSHYWTPVRRAASPPVAAVASGESSKRSRTPRGGKEVPPDFRRNPLIFFSSAPKDSLVLLPGVGPVLADRIVSARIGKRSFTRWEDLLAIKGIGPKTLERMKRLADAANP